MESGDARPGLSPWLRLGRALGLGGLAAVIVLCAPASAAAQPAPFEWEVAAGGNGHFYEYVTTPLSWGDARTAAAGRVFRGATGHLVTITSAGENAFVTSLRARMGLPDLRGWIGLSDPSGSFGWQWVTGEAFGYTNWNAGEPNNPGSERWVEIFGSGAWNNNTESTFFNQGYVVEYENVDTTAPTLVVVRPGSSTPATTFSSTLVVRGRASDAGGIARVTWSAGSRSGVATGTDGGSVLSWIIRGLPLVVGANTVTITAEDRSGNTSSATVSATRLAEASLVALTFDGQPVEEDGSQVLSTGTLVAQVDPALAVPALRLLLNGAALEGARSGNTLTAPLDASALPADPATALTYELTVQVEGADGASLEKRIPVRLSSPVEPVARQDASSLWRSLPPLASGSIRDLAVTAGGDVWAVAGGPVTVTETTVPEVVDGALVYVTRVSGTAANNALWHWDGSGWTAFPPSIFSTAGLVFTAVAVDGANAGVGGASLWIGTNRGLIRATPGSGSAPPVLNEILDAASGLAGSWVTSIRQDPAGTLFVGHRGSRYYRLKENAVRRFWLDSGGVSVGSAGGPWSVHRSEKRDDGSWTGVAGFDVSAIAPAAGGFWAASEAGLSRFDAGSWSYENVGTGMPFDDVRALAAPQPDEVWAAGPQGAALLRKGTWASFTSAVSPLPPGGVNDVLVDAAGRVFLATDGGLASFEPNGLVWTQHPEAGPGSAGALSLSSAGLAWAGLATGAEATVSEFNAAAGLPLTAPSDGARILTDGTGVARVTLEWEAAPGALSYELFLDGRPLGRSATPGRTLDLPAGTWKWTARAVYAGNVAGPRALARALTVADSRERTDTDVLIFSIGDGLCTSGRGLRPTAHAAFRPRESAAWEQYAIDPGFQGGLLDAGSFRVLPLDLAAGADARLVSVSYGDQAIPEQYPTPLPAPLPARRTEWNWRVDITSETDGLVLGEEKSASFSLFNRRQGETFHTLPPEALLLDVAGLADGRVAVLGALGVGREVLVYEHSEAVAEPARLVRRVTEVDPGASRIAGFRDGGFAVLAAGAVALYDATFVRRRDDLALPALAAGEEAFPLDLAIDDDARILVLLEAKRTTPAASRPAVYLTRDLGPASSWTLVPFNLPVNCGSDRSFPWRSIASFTAPRPRVAAPRKPDLEPAPPTGSVPIPGTDLTVSGGTCASTSGPLWILGFLRTEGPISCSASEVSGNGGLWLDYAGYGSPPTGAPIGPNAIPLVNGGFRISVADGSITSTTGSFAADVAPLGALEVSKLGLMGMGPYAGATKRKGVALVGRTATRFGAFSQPLEFATLFLTDVGGVFHRTFGGIDGILAPYDAGALSFPTVPVRIKTAGDLATAGCTLNFASVTAEVLSPAGAVQFPLTLDGLCVHPDRVSFARSSMNFLDLFDLTIEAGAVTATGVRAGSAGIALAGKTYAVTNFAAGSDGFAFDNAPGFDFAGVEAELQNVKLVLPQGGAGGAFEAGLARLKIDRSSKKDYGVPGNLVVTGNDTITKSGGLSFVDFGFKVGGRVTISAAEDPANDGNRTLSGVSANALVVQGGGLTNNADDDTMRLAAENPTAFEGRLDDLNVQFDFFKSPSASNFPRAGGGLVRVGPEDDPTFKLNIDPGTVISRTEIVIPPFELVTKKPAFRADFKGGRITPQFVELNDPDPVNLFGVKLDFALTRVGTNGFFTSKAEVTAGKTSLIKVTLRDFSIDQTGKVGISGGGFQKAGFGFDLTTTDPACLSTDAAFRFHGEVSLPVVQRARGCVTVADDNVSISGFTFDALTLGPLRVKNPLFGTDCPAPLPTAGPGRDLFFGATVGFGRFPDVTGRLCLNNGRFAYLGMAAEFPPPGFQLYGPTYLQRVDGSYDHVRQEMKASVLISGGPRLSFEPLVRGSYYLVTLKGSVTISGLGYFQTNAELRLLHGPSGCTGGPPCFQGFLMGQSTAIVGNVYLNGRFVGVGMYFNGSVLLFNGVLNVNMTAWVYPPLGAGLTPGPQQGSFGGDLKGTLQVPPYVPLIGGKTFGNAAVALRGSFTNPASTAFSGTVQIPLCTPPVYYCTGVKFCQSCANTFLGRICSPPYPCGATGCGWRDKCWNIDVGFRIDSRGFSASQNDLVASAAVPGFAGGYRQTDGVSYFTNFRLLGSRTVGVAGTAGGPLASPADVRSVTFEVPQGVDEAIVRIDFSSLDGDANLRLRFPDGRIYTPESTPPFTFGATPSEPVPGEPLIFYRHEIHLPDPADPADRPLKEAAYVFRGPFEFQRVDLTDENGTPTGEAAEFFAPARIPAGVYEVIVDSTGAAGEARVEFLLGNQAPSLTRSELQPLGEDRYRLVWTASDPEGDALSVKLHLGTDPSMPGFSLPLGLEEGYGATGSFEFDLRTPEFRALNITAPLQVFVSVSDGRAEPVYVNVGTLSPVVSEKGPSRVAGVVARPRHDGAVEVYWDPVPFASSPALHLSSYGVVAQEVGPKGTVGLPVTAAVAVPPPGSADPHLTEALVSGLQPGRKYAVTVSAVAEETVLGGGPPLCPCNPDPLPAPDDACFGKTDPPACEQPSDLRVQHTGPPSSPGVVEIPLGALNAPPRFLSTVPELARIGKPYTAPVRVEDPDGDSVELLVCGCATLEGEPPTSTCDAPLARCDAPKPAGLRLVQASGLSALNLAPTGADAGRHLNVLVARDGRGGEALQRFEVQVVNAGEGRTQASFASEPPTAVLLGETFAYQIALVGLPEGLVPRFVLGAGPPAMRVGTETGLVTWTPAPGDLGTHAVTLEALDADPSCSTCGGESLGTQSFTLDVRENPLGQVIPVLAVNPPFHAVGPDTAVVEFGVANAGTGSLEWTARADGVGGFLTVLDGAAGAGPGTVRVAVEANPESSPRVGVVRIEATSPSGPVASSPRLVEIRQDAARLAVISIDPDRFRTSDRAAQEIPVQIRNAGSGSMDWSAFVLSGNDFLSLAGGLAENTGTNAGTITVRLSANDTGKTRRGVVRIQSPAARSGFVDFEVTQSWDYFTDVSAASGLNEPGHRGGVTFCDLNGDGLLDLLVNEDRERRRRGRSHLYFNRGDGTFQDVTGSHAAGLAAGGGHRSVVCGDLDGDGVTDIVRTVSRRIEVYLGRGAAATPAWSFGDRRQRPSQVIDCAPGDERFEGLGLLDFDNDGLLDLAVDDGPSGVLVYRNHGRGELRPGGHRGLPSRSGGGDFLAVGDYDVDGRVDVLSRQRGVFNLSRNRGGRFRPNRSFTEAGARNDNKGAVGLCDLDADGDFDALWTDGGVTQVWRNDAGVFTPTGEPGLSAGVDLSAENVDGLACGDVDNDGDLDVFLSTARGPGHLFVNRTAPGPDSPLAFTRDNAGLALDSAVTSVAFGDYDADGDLDLVAASDDGTNQLWQSGWNDSGRADYLQVRVLHPLVGGGTRDEIGAAVRLFEADGTTPVGPVQEVNGGGGHGSQAAAVLHFGLPSGPDRRYVVEVRFLGECGRPGPVVREEVVPSSLGSPRLLEVTRPPDGGGKGRHSCPCGPRPR